MNKATIFLTFTFFILTSNLVSAANVLSTSEESFAQYGKEDAYWVVTVNCDDNTAYVVQRKTDGVRWCPKGNNSLCSNDKSVAAKNSCSEANTAVAKKAKVIKAKAAPIQQENARLTFEQREAAEKAAVERKIREAEYKLQQRIDNDEKLLLISTELSNLSLREQQIEQRIIEIDELLDN